jgi:ABC-type nitrate/sulfonate/bicarbonate transport system substrate-binding protein
MKRATFTATAAAAVCAPRIARAQTLVPVRIGTIASDGYALTIYAKEQGFFARNGIDGQVQYIASASGGITAALVGGALDIGCASMGAISNAHLRGIPIELIAGGGIITSQAPTTLFVVAKNSPIMSCRDLNGKTVGASALRDVINVAEAKFIDANGGNSKTVSFVELTPSAAPAALLAGRIDAYALSEPTLTLTKNDLRSLGGVYDAIGRRVMISVHMAMKPWLDANVDTARRVVRALGQAATWTNATANRGAADAIIARESKVPIEVVSRMNHVVYSDDFDPSIIQPQIDALADYKFIDHRYSVGDVIWPGAAAARAGA